MPLVGAGCCQGAQGCRIFDDNFNRAPAADLGSNWDVLEGDWRTNDDEVHCPEVCDVGPCAHAHASVSGTGPSWWTGVGWPTPGTGANIAMCRRPHSVPDESMSVSVRILDEAPRQYYLVILNAQYNPATQVLGNFYWALYYTGDPITNAAQWVGVGYYDGAVHLLALNYVDEDTWEGYHPLFDTCDGRQFGAHFGSDGICAAITHAVISLAWSGGGEGGGDVGFPGGYYSGIGAWGEGPFHLNWFHFDQHHDTHPDCSYCVCKCDEKVIPKSLTVTIRATGCLSAMDGTEIPIEYDEDHAFWWFKSDDDDGWYTDGPCCDWDITLQCAGDASGTDAISVYIEGRENRDCMCAFPIKGPYYPSAGISTCDPIYWVIERAPGEPFGIGSICSECCPELPPVGTWWLEITA